MRTSQIGTVSDEVSHLSSVGQTVGSAYHPLESVRILAKGHDEG